MRPLRVSEAELKKLQRKSDRQMVVEQYPEKVDQIVKLMDRTDKLERKVDKILRTIKGLHTRDNNMMKIALENQQAIFAVMEVRRANL